jgi:acetyl-CoA carboxylase alpha subunit
LPQRQRYRESRSFSRAARHFNLPVVFLDDPAG